MTKHTPGPWTVVGATLVWRTGPDGAAVALTAEPEVKTSADFKPVNLSSRRFSEACANAQLIAAAPALLEALKGILDIGKRDTSNPKYDGYYQTAREAIAKAEGHND